MEVREKYIARMMSMPQDYGFTEVKFMQAAQVITGSWVRLRCQYLCKPDRQALLSPPNTPESEDMAGLFEDYKTGLMMRREIEVNEILDIGAEQMWAEFQDAMIRAENEAFIRGYGRAFCVGVGNCIFCHHDDSIRPCGYPEKRRPTLEAVGINLHDTLDMIGWQSLLVRDPGDPFQLFGLLLLN